MRHAVIVADFMERRRQQAWEHRQQRRWYFIKQCLYGIALIAITMLAVMTLDGDATIAVFTLPLAGYLLFSKEMLIFRSRKEKKNHGKKLKNAVEHGGYHGKYGSH